MDVGEIQKFMQMMGCQKISVGSQWVRSTCPVNYLHSGGKDSTPSFAISINPGDESNCRCLACGVYGALIPLVWRLELGGRRPRPDLFDFLKSHNQMNTEKLNLDQEHEPAPDDIEGQIKAARKWVAPSKRKSTFVHPDDEPQAEVPESVLRKMIADMPDHVRAFLARQPDPVTGIRGRGMSPFTISEWELGWHRFKCRIAIPIRDEAGKLVSISGRTFDDGVCAHCKASLPKGGADCPSCGRSQPPKYLHSPFKRDRVLYGEHKRDAAIRSGYLLEGFFQTMATWQEGYVNPLARMGSHLSQQQAEKLVRWFDHLTIVPDGDKAGRDAAERDRQTLLSLSLDGDQGQVFRIQQIDIADMPNKMDADTVKPSVLRHLLGPRNTC